MKCQHMACHQCEDEAVATLRAELTKAKEQILAAQKALGNGTDDEAWRPGETAVAALIRFRQEALDGEAVANNYRELVKTLSAISLIERDRSSSDSAKVEEMAKIARLALKATKQLEPEEQDELRVSGLWHERNKAIKHAAELELALERCANRADKLYAALKLLMEEATDEARCADEVGPGTYRHQLSEPCKALVAEALKTHEEP